MLDERGVADDVESAGDGSDEVRELREGDISEEEEDVVGVKVEGTFCVCERSVDGSMATEEEEEEAEISKDCLVFM